MLLTVFYFQYATKSSMHMKNNERRQDSLTNCSKVKARAIYTYFTKLRTLRASQFSILDESWVLNFQTLTIHYRNTCMSTKMYFEL